MNKIIYFLKKFNVLYLYVLIGLLLVFSIMMTYLFTTKEKTVTKTIELVKAEEPKKEVIRVDVKGYVENPGVYELDENDRVMDAINKAGGLKENANTTLINLSMKIFDEMTIIIYSNEEMEKFKSDQNQKEIEYVYVEIEKCPDKINDACLEKETTISNVSVKEETNQEKNTKKQDNKNLKTTETKENNKTTSSKENNTSNKEENLLNNNEKVDNFKEGNKIEETTVININSATKEELQTLSGIGESKANAIINFREENGLFKDISEITNISGIGEKQFEKIKDHITI